MVLANAQIFDTDSLKHLKTYTTDRPVNSASISSLKDHVILGGGQEAMQVTTTSTRAGKFEVRIFHKIFEEEIGRVKGHFGPINTVRFQPDGKGYVAAGGVAMVVGRGTLTHTCSCRTLGRVLLPGSPAAVRTAMYDSTTSTQTTSRSRSTTRRSACT